MTRPGDEIVPLGGSDDDETVRRLRRALAREADMVQPSDDGLERIRQGTSGQDGGRRWVPWAAAVAAAAVIGLVVGGILGFGRGTDDADGNVALPAATSTGTPQDTSPATSEPATSTAPAPAAGVSGIPVYWLGESKVSVWLYREFREVPDLGDRVTSAVAAMTREKPVDPDYFNPWSPASRVATSMKGDSVYVDLSADAFSNRDIGSETASRAIQQLVYTATAAAQSSGTVTITVDGKPYDAWGTVRLGEPMKRAPLVDVQAPTWVVSPTEAETVRAGKVTVTGYGTAFEGTFSWEVRDTASGKVVADGVTQGGSMGTFGEFRFSTQLKPGTYTVEVYQADMSDGESSEGPRMYPDTKDFTVK
jgi:hypothetical protein